jgi:hypothetical protein
MTTLTLLTKIYNSHQLKQIGGIIEELLGDLNVEAAVKGTAGGRWVQLDVSGEDEAIATKLLEREIGFCPVSLVNVKKFDELKGYVTNWGKRPDELVLDVGVFQPKSVYAVVSLSQLQGHLGMDAKLVSLKKLGEAWGFCENLPLKVKVLDAAGEEERIKAELDQSQVHRYLQWRNSLLDRLFVIGASLNEVNAVVEQEGLSRDVIDLESFGLFEHALVCKLGTDATGLVGRLGRRLRKAKFTVFSPKPMWLQAAQ